MMSLCRELGTRVIAEGVETREEYLALRDLGVELFQGYYFARPAFRALAGLPAAAVYDR
jgi:EAL domain-containing protein (putative c-di-GMP-specific phosphodiesterase class I)